MNELDLFAAAIAITDPGERAALLERECAGRPHVRIRLDQLLLEHFKSNPLLDAPGREQTGDYGDSGSSTASLPSGLEAEGTVIAGRYKLLEQIGEGGMGSVWMADQTMPVRRRVAVKLIRVERGNSKTILSRFEAERQAIALMDHPHIAKLLDAGTTVDGSPFFVMELVKGIPLTEYCDAHKLSIRDRLQLFTQICSAVQHAHQKGIIHRDLKPSNILVESHDDKPVPRVIDFGLAKAISGMQLSENTLFTAFGSVMGTPLYMAPEQANFNAVDVDTRSDVYALGVMLYELLTGTTPITRESMKTAALDEMLKLIREQDAQTPSSRLSTLESAPSIAANRQMEPQKLGRFVKGELDWIVMKALNKERDRRYETANGFARDIERFLNNETVAAGPPRTSYRLRKFVRRNRGQVIAAGLVLLVLIGGIIGTSFGLIQAKKSAEEEWAAKIEAQKNEELANKRLAQVEAEKQIAQAVRDFLQRKLLGQADVAAKADDLIKAGGLAAEAKQNPTIRELLDRTAGELAEDKIEANFPMQPLLQAEILRTVGDAYHSVGELERAIGFVQRSLALRKQHLGPDHPDTLMTMNDLSKAYMAAGKLDLALPLMNEALASHRKSVPKDSPQLAQRLAFVGRYLLEDRAFAEAEPLLRECLAIRVKKEPDDWQTFNTQSTLGGALLGQKKYAESETLLLKGYEGMKQREKRIPAQGAIRVSEALDRLIELYTATNQPDDVKKWRAERAKYPGTKPAEKK